MDEHTHTHIGPDGRVYTHTHSHTQTKAVLNRLSRAIGHLESVKKMVESGRDCTEVLIQLAAVRSALNNTAKVILKDHIEHCVMDAAEAKKLMRQVDKDRSSYYKYYTDQIWGEAENYDLCVDSSRIGIQGSVGVIRAYMDAVNKGNT